MTRRRALLLSGAVALLAAVAITLAGALDRAELWTTDLRFTVRGEQPFDGYAVVAIDQKTFGDLKVAWPLRRRFHAQVVDRLSAAGARKIVYDVQFTEPSGRRGDDFALTEAVRRAGGVVLATGESNKQGRTGVFGGDKYVARARAKAAAAGFPSAVIREYEPSISRLPTIAATVGSDLGEAVDPDRFGSDGQALIDYRGPPGTVATYSFSDVKAGRIDPELLRDRIVVVGATAPTLQDLHQTSAGGGLMAGPEIQANAIWTAMHGNPLQESADWLGLVLLLAAGIAGPLAVLALGPPRGAALAVFAGAGYAAGAQAAFGAGTVLPVAAPLFALVLGTVATVITGAAAEAADRRRVARLNSDLETAVRQRTSELEAKQLEVVETQLEVVERLARAAELRDDDTGQHVDRMSRLCELVALELGRPPEDAELLRRAAVLHDVGKIGLDDGILRKPGRLTEEEITVMRKHTLAGAELLAGSHSPVLCLAEDVALSHHERWDGSGYPAGLQGEAIPLEGRIAAVCDVFDALVSRRPYKEPWTFTQARAEIIAQRGAHFDPAVADALLAVLDREDESAFVADMAAPGPPSLSSRDLEPSGDRRAPPALSR